MNNSYHDKYLQDIATLETAIKETAAKETAVKETAAKETADIKVDKLAGMSRYYK